MRSLVSALRGLRPMVLAIAVTLCAAALVLYYQHRALTTLESQTAIILKQVAEQAASDIAVEARRTLDGPVYETLTAVNHPELRAGSPRSGRARIPGRARAHIRTSIGSLCWSDDTEDAAPGEVVFVDRRAPGPGRRPGWPSHGRRRSQRLQFGAIPRSAAPSSRSPGTTRRNSTFTSRREDVGPRRLQALLRLFWSDARRVIVLRDARASSSIPRPAGNGCSTRSTSAASRRC